MCLYRMMPDFHYISCTGDPLYKGPIKGDIKGNISVKSEWFLVSHYIPLLLLFEHQTSRDVFDSLTSCLRGIWTCQHHLLVNFWMGSCSVRLSNRRKFRSLTSDNMDSWKSSAARKKINRCGKKEDPQARNVREVVKCCVFQCFVCRLGRKVTSLKRRVRR